MTDAPIPKNEEERIAAVRDLAILDTTPEVRFDRITDLATKLFGAPISTLTIMDSNREFYKSCQGVAERESPRAISFCGHAIASEEDMLIIEDTKKDPRFMDNPMVVRPPYVRFYAGVPIYSLNGQKVGVFCIKDTKPRKLSDSESFLLRTLASWAELEVNIVGLKKILSEGEPNGRLDTFLERLTHRDVIGNLASVRFGLKVKNDKWTEADKLAVDKAILHVEGLIMKLKRLKEQV